MTLKLGMTLGDGVSQSYRLRRGKSIGNEGLVGENITPKHFDGLKAWFDQTDAQYLIKDESNKIQEFVDRSNNKRNAVQSTGTYQPAWTTAAYNGIPGARFDGTDDYVYVPSSTDYFKFLHDGTGMTILSGVQALNQSQPAGLISCRETNQVGFRNHISASQSVRYNATVNSGNTFAFNLFINGKPLQDEIYHCIGAKFDNLTESQSTSYLDADINQEQNTVTAPTSSNAGLDLTIGVSAQTGPDSPFSGNWFMTTIYNQALSTTPIKHLQRNSMRIMG
jgi:hypothetical protein